jgi:REP element-mobilizing transposase RayT
MVRFIVIGILARDAREAWPRRGKDPNSRGRAQRGHGSIRRKGEPRQRRNRKRPAMANTYTQILYHIVFSTKNRLRCIEPARRDDLYGYIWGINKNLKCHLYRIGGVEDHVHILTSIHPRVALADYIEKVKTGSTHWIRREGVFPDWPGWQDGYGAFTASFGEKDSLIEYVKAQEEHHRMVSFMDEYRALLARAGVAYDPKYLV